MLTALGIVALLAIGFGLGRIKNAGKIASVKSHLIAAEASATAEVKKLIAEVRAKLSL